MMAAIARAPSPEPRERAVEPKADKAADRFEVARDDAPTTDEVTGSLQLPSSLFAGALALTH